jgi:uncharacterized protein YdhG (YjbR/CyaY superfamily)
MAGAEDVDAYIAGLPETRRTVMSRMREAIRAGAPEATEAISYRMPAFRLDGRFLVSYDAYTAHYSLFPASERVVATLGPAVAPYLSGRGTIRFPADEPLPEALVTRVARIRVAEEREARAGRD